MKRKIIIPIFAVLTSFAFGQTEYEALRHSQTEINGTARYMSLGGAMGALGADASAINDNPAGLGVYRSSEVTATVNLSDYKYRKVDWDNNNRIQASKAKLKLDNVAYVLAVPTYDDSSGWLSSNISFSYQKLKDYNKSFYANKGGVDVSILDYIENLSNPDKAIPGDMSYDNGNMPWLTVLGYDGFLIDPIDGGYFQSILDPGELVDASIAYTQGGSLGEVSFGWGGNYNNNLFLGTSVNIRALNYYLSSRYTEDFRGDRGFDLDNYLTRDGIGINAKFGVIYLPTNNLRLGASLHTPSATSITEESYADIYSSEIPEEFDYPAETPILGQDYLLYNPMQAHLSAAYLFGKKGFISGEYNFVNYAGTRFRDKRNSQYLFDEINNDMSRVLNNVHVMKVGAEWRATPNFALRAGYATITPPVNIAYDDGKLLMGNSSSTNTEYFDQKYNINFYTFGFGYRTNEWFLDFAFVQRAQSEDFFPYQAKVLTPVKLDHLTNNFIFTGGLRF